MKKTYLRYFAGLSLLLFLVGCGPTKYQCPMPSGVACMSATSIYKATNAPGQAGMDAVVGTSKSSNHAEQTPARVTQTAAGDSGVVLPLPKPGDVIPIREQARVMRIWIAPWVDTAGNLNMASRVYSEIEPKRWAVGENVGDSSPNFYPLQVEPDTPAPAVKSDATVTPGAQITAGGMDSASP